MSVMVTKKEILGVIGNADSCTAGKEFGLRPARALVSSSIE